MLRAERTISLLNRNIVKNREGKNLVQPYQFLTGFVDETKPEEKKEDIKARIESELQAALKQAEDILNTARAESDMMRKKAFDEGREQGYQEGYSAGYTEGHQKAYEEQTERMEADVVKGREDIKEMLESVTAQKNKLLEKYIDDLKLICLAVAEKIIQTSLRSSGEVIKRMILSATDKLKKTQWAKIYISRMDSELMIQADLQLLKELAHLSDNIKIVVMDNDEQGTCILELPEEIIDVSVNTQLENIKDILNNARL